MFKIGDIVDITYGGIDYIGKIRSIYNDGNTINVDFNKWCTAFYHKNVRPHVSYVIRYRNKIIIKF
jgi:hypothetical protein